RVRLGERSRSDGGERADRDENVDRERDREREGYGLRDGVGGVVDLLAEGGDAGVAGEGEKQQPGGLEGAVGTVSGEISEVGGAGAATERGAGDDERQRDEYDGDDDSRESGGLVDAAVVDRGEADDGG